MKTSSSFDHVSITSSYHLFSLAFSLSLSRARAPLSTASKAERAKQELERYLHYYQRYHGHADALKHAANTRLQTEKRMGDIQEKEKSSWIDVEFLKQANEQIIECRRVLKYTYVLGFFLEDNTAVKHLFEHQQEMLEKNTEQLHRYAGCCPPSSSLLLSSLLSTPLSPSQPTLPFSSFPDTSR